MRVGIGYDVHRLAAGQDLVLGGIRIPHNKGLSGHSDADVLAHAIIDALLGAAGLRDIGSQFPTDDPKYKGISSMFLLKKANDLINTRGFDIKNIDATVVAQNPRLSPHIDRMRQQISHTLGITLEQVMIKAKTTDGLGFAGVGKGIAAYAVCLVEASEDANPAKGKI